MHSSATAPSLFSPSLADPCQLTQHLLLPYPSASGFPSNPSASPTIPPAAPIPSRFPYPPQPPQPVIMTLDNTSIPFNVSEHYEVLEMIGEGAYGVVV